MKIEIKIFLILSIVLLIDSDIFSQSAAVEFYNKGVQYAVQGEFVKAKEEFDKVLKIDSLYSQAELGLKTINDISKKKIMQETGIHIFKGVYYDEQGKFEQAISEYIKAIEMNPNYEVAYNNRGMSYYNQGEYERAISDYTKAIGLNPKYADAYNNRGIVYYEQGQNNLAISDYSMAIELNALYAKAYHNRGLLYIVVLKDNEKGCADWQRACELGECYNYYIAKEKGFCP
ncbi:MAG TPA: tetratricopeptide repeat protein [Ignavibacteriaceae bacterium]|nr:tetratricopeptide repeat protein [Ignavibacteriaceae bacterium]